VYAEGVSEDATPTNYSATGCHEASICTNVYNYTTN